MQDPGPIPVQDYLHLSWVTASESNNYGFEIQRSTKPTAGFETIHFIAGKGDTNQARAYEFSDFSVLPGVAYYYRLRQIDMDQTESFSAIKVGQIEDFSKNKLLISPNPTNGILQINHQSLNENAEITLFDSEGKLVFREKNMDAANGITTLNLNHLPAGIYFLKMINAQEVWMERLIKN